MSSGRVPGGAVLLPALLVLISVPAFFDLSCDREKIAGPISESSYLPQSSPENCLENLKKAYNERDPQEYARLFSEDFTFFFSRENLDYPYWPVPMAWDLVAELQSAVRMMLSESVLKVEVSFVVNSAVADLSRPGATMQIAQDKINLRVTTTREDGSTLIYLVDSAHGRFYFREYVGEQAYDGGHVWRIARWEDNPAAGKVDKSSWGLVKCIYSAPDPTRPAPVTDLAARRSVDGVVLTWTAVGDDSLQGHASSYDIRSLGQSITQANWSQATRQGDLFHYPSPSGVADSVVVQGVSIPEGGLFFALKVSDERRNWSRISNVASVAGP